RPLRDSPTRTARLAHILTATRAHSRRHSRTRRARLAETDDETRLHPARDSPTAWDRRAGERGFARRRHPSDERIVAYWQATIRRSYDADRRTHARSARRAASPDVRFPRHPELPPLHLGPGRLARGHLDADDRTVVAGPAAHRVGHRRRRGRRPADAADPAVRPVR